MKSLAAYMTACFDQFDVPRSCISKRDNQVPISYFRNTRDRDGIVVVDNGGFTLVSASLLELRRLDFPPGQKDARIVLIGIIIFKFLLQGLDLGLLVKLNNRYY